jgi:hypothetical protein
MMAVPGPAVDFAGKYVIVGIDIFRIAVTPLLTSLTSSLEAFLLFGISAGYKGNVD